MNLPNTNARHVTLKCSHHHDTLINGLWKLYLSNRGTDFMFQWGSRFIFAHQLIVDVFLPKDRLLICGISLSSSNPVDINVIDAVMQFIYRGKVAVPRELLNCLLHVSLKLGFRMLMHAVQLAKRTAQQHGAANAATVESPFHQPTLIQKLWLLYVDRREVDFVVHWAGSSIPAHLIVVHSFLSTDRIFECAALGSDVCHTSDAGGNLNHLLQFLYRGAVDVERNLLPNLLEIAKELDFPLLVEAIASSDAVLPLDTLVAVEESRAKLNPHTNDSAGCPEEDGNLSTRNRVCLAESSAFDTDVSIYSALECDQDTGNAAACSNARSGDRELGSSVESDAIGLEEVLEAPASPDLLWLASDVGQPRVLLQRLPTLRCRQCSYQTHMGDSKGFRRHRAIHREERHPPHVASPETRSFCLRKSAAAACTFSNCTFVASNQNLLLTHEMEVHLMGNLDEPIPVDSGIDGNGRSPHREVLSTKSSVDSDKPLEWVSPKPAKAKPPMLVVPPYRNDVEVCEQVEIQQIAEEQWVGSADLEKVVVEPITCSKVGLPVPANAVTASGAVGSLESPLDSETRTFECKVCEDSIVGCTNFAVHMEGHILS